MKHLHEIKGRFAVRITVPPELRGIVGRRELREWLGRDGKVAQRNAHAVIARFLADLDSARAKLDASAPTIRSVARAHYENELLIDDRERVSAGATAVALSRRLFGTTRASLLRLLAAGQLPADEAEAVMGWAADDLIASGTAPTGVDRRALLKGLAEAQLEALARFGERDDGKVNLAPPVSPLLATEDEPAPAAPQAKKKGTGPTLSTLLADFHQERTAGNRTLSDKTMAEHKVAVRMLDEFLGNGTPAASITKADMKEVARGIWTGG